MAVGAPIRTALLLGQIILTDIITTGSRTTALTTITATPVTGINAGLGRSMSAEMPPMIIAAVTPDRQ